MPIDTQDERRRQVGTLLVLLWMIALVACIDSENDRVVAEVYAPSGGHYVEHAQNDLTAPLQVSKTVVCVIKNDRSWMPDYELVAVLNGRPDVHIKWISDTEVEVFVVSAQMTPDLLDVGQSRWDGIRIRLMVGSELIDQTAWKKKYGRHGRL